MNNLEVKNKIVKKKKRGRKGGIKRSIGRLENQIKSVHKEFLHDKIDIELMQNKVQTLKISLEEKQDQFSKKYLKINKNSEIKKSEEQNKATSNAVPLDKLIIKLQSKLIKSTADNKVNNWFKKNNK